ncbi:hypothetical protein J9303_04015 [Bacillaceae bacterium Marseille-Q3522]|nr:hypothetical protein [Bacillaceae bacterium Marseille-Q3522]
MNKCMVCNSDVIKLEALNAEIIDFVEKDNNETFHFSFTINNKNLTSGIIQGEVRNSFYCDKCKKIYMELDRV